MSPKSAWNLTTPSGLTIVLSPDEYRLAILGLIDFEGRWDAMQVATTLVVDGETKGALLRERIAPVADLLPALVADGIEVLALWTARHWFANQPCQSTAATRGTGEPADGKPEGSQEDA